MGRSSDNSEDILSRLDVAAEYRSMGVEFTGRTPNADGWLECWAMGRPHGDKPNAGCNLQTGRYKDFGHGGDNLSLWDFAARYGGHATWQAARDHFAAQAGVKVNGQHSPKARKPDEHLEFEDWNDAIVGLWLRHKMGITAEALQAAGARLARYRHQYTVVALPVFSWPLLPDAAAPKPIGWVMWNTTGGELPVKWGDDSKPTAYAKMKTAGGSASGLMGLSGLQAIAAGTVERVLKVEGPSDMLAAWAIIPVDQRHRFAVVTNSGGSGETPEPWNLEVFRGLPRADVLHDADVPGDKGAAKWSEAIARIASVTYRGKLPYPATDSKGKDLRDWIGEGNGWSELLQLLDAGERVASTSVKAEESVEDPHRLARTFLDRHTIDGMRTLVSWRDEWHRWNGKAYERVPGCDIKAELSSFVKSEFDRDNIEAQADRANWRGDKPPKVKQVTATLLNNVAQAIAGYSLVPSRIEQPAWISGEHELNGNPQDLLSVDNGLLHMPSLMAEAETADISSHTPAFFSPNVLEFRFDHSAECPNWLAFLNSVWADDPPSIETLQEFMGYCLIPDTRHHKMLMLVGPTRSGKGTIGRVLRRLVGPHNLCSPTLADLAGPFGLWPLAGKLVALVADARLSGRTDSVAVVERLLSITGEDPQDVHRKNLPTLTGVRMTARFVLMTNELPSLKDASGALMARVILLRTTRAFAGKEDRSLGDRLAAELPGILNWAIQGWRRLQERGIFIQPASAKETLQAMSDIASPISAFLRDACHVGPEFSTPIQELFHEWKLWCESKGRKEVGTEHTFAKDLRSVLPNLITKSLRITLSSKEHRIRHYYGVSGTRWYANPSFLTRGESDEKIDDKEIIHSNKRNGVERVPTRTTLFESSEPSGSPETSEPSRESSTHDEGIL